MFAEFNKQYASIRDTLMEKYKQKIHLIKINDSDTDEELLRKIAWQTYQQSEKLAELDEDNDDTAINVEAEAEKFYSSEEYKVYEFLVLIGVAGYFSLVSFDVNAKNIKLGYKDCFEGIKLNYEMRMQQTKNADEKICTAFLATCRNKARSAYISDKDYDKDIKFVCALLNSEKEEDKEPSDNEIIISKVFGSQIKVAIQIIRDTYTDLMAASFGIRKYVGVFNGNNIIAGIDSTKNTPKVIEPASTLKNIYVPELKKAMHLDTGEVQVAKKVRDGVETDNIRYFDNNLIYSTFLEGNNTILYFPYKILEILGMRRYIRKSENLTYNYDSEEGYRKNLKNYIGYLTKNIEKDLKSFILICAESQYNSRMKDIKETDSGYYTFREFYDEGKKVSDAFDAEAIDHPDKNTVIKFIQDLINYYVKCVCTTCMVTELSKKKASNGSDKDAEITAYRIKVSGSVDLMPNTEFVRDIDTTVNASISTATNVEQNVPKTINKDLNIHTIDYAYIFNLKIVEGRPVFAFKALDTLKEQGEIPTYDDVMLGRFADGSICRLNGDKALTKHNTHFLFAGSRSGKGVMGYNIFATLLGVGYPLFYLDRKPDTSVVLKSIAPEMFSINGSQYNDEMDLQGVYKEEKMIYHIPPVLRGMYTDENKADFAYIRGLLLVLNMICFLDESAVNYPPKLQAVQKEMLDLLQGCTTIALVVDEYTNLIDNIGKDINFYSGFGAKALSDTGISNWSELRSKVKKATNRLNTANSSEAKNKEEKIASAQDALDNALESAATFDIVSLAKTQFMLNFLSIRKKFFEGKNAAGQFRNAAQIFVIGQTLPYTSIDAVGEKPEEGSGNKRWKITGSTLTPDVDIICQTLAKLKNEYDCIVGYHASGRNSADTEPDGCGKNAGQNIKGTLSNAKMSLESGYFLHAENATDIATLGQKCNGNPNKINEWLNANALLFKPFLILNGGDLPNENYLGVDGDYSRIPDATLLGENGTYFKERKKGAGQYVGQCLTRCNLAGISYQDILDDSHAEDDETKLDPRVGFEDYVKSMFNGDGYREKLNLSGKLANIFVKGVWGYEGTAEEFCRDFRFEYSAINPKMCSSGDVKIGLQETFFHPALTKDTSFAQVFKDDLGGLYSYYTGEAVVSSDTMQTEDGVDFNQSDSDEDFTQSDPSVDSDGTYEDSYTEDLNTDDYEDSEPAYSDNQESAPVITDEERRQISDMVVEVVMGVVRDRLKAGVDIPDDEIHACVVNIREQLEQMILADKQRGADN